MEFGYSSDSGTHLSCVLLLSIIEILSFFLVDCLSRSQRSVIAGFDVFNGLLVVKVGDVLFSADPQSDHPFNR